MPEIAYQNESWQTLHSFEPDSYSGYLVIGCNVDYLALSYYFKDYTYHIAQLHGSCDTTYNAPHISFTFTEANKTDLFIIKLNNKYNF
jgi:hypothetical protein